MWHALSTEEYAKKDIHYLRMGLSGRVETHACCIIHQYTKEGEPVLQIYIQLEDGAKDYEGISQMTMYEWVGE